MQLKITTDYAVRTLVHLAKEGDRVVSSGEIASEMCIPQKYLIRLGGQLRDAGLVHAHAGQYGGYSLAKDPSKITLFEVLTLTEPTLKLNRCMEEDHFCNRGATEECPIRRFYTAIQEKWEAFLKGITLADLVADPSKADIEEKILAAARAE